MARYNFKPDLNREIRRVFKNFNEKQSRDARRKGKALVPERISVKAFKERFSDKSEKEILSQLKIYESYNKGGKKSLDFASAGSRLSRWEASRFKTLIPKTISWYESEIGELQNIIGDRPEFFLRQHQRLGTLEDQVESLYSAMERMDELTDTEIKSIRRYITKAERSELTKERGFRLYLAQVERVMKLGRIKDENGNLVKIPKEKREEILNKFNVLTVNEFMEMYNKEDIVARFYNLVDSPKGRGHYELTSDDENVAQILADLIDDVDNIIARAKNHK